MERSTIFKFGKPSISIRAMALPWRSVSHNQRVSELHVTVMSLIPRWPGGWPVGVPGLVNLQKAIDNGPVEIVDLPSGFYAHKNHLMSHQVLVQICGNKHLLHIGPQLYPISRQLPGRAPWRAKRVATCCLFCEKAFARLE